MTLMLIEESVSAQVIVGLTICVWLVLAAMRKGVSSVLVGRLRGFLSTLPPVSSRDSSCLQNFVRRSSANRFFGLWLLPIGVVVDVRSSPVEEDFNG